MVFISYTHKDEDICNRVVSLLKEYDIDFWVDKNGIPPSAENFNEEIQKAIVSSADFICIWTDKIKESNYCKRELNLAFELKERNPTNRNIYFLQMGDSLDHLTDMPAGCGIQMVGTNVLFSYNESLLRNSIISISENINKTLIQGVSFEDFTNAIKNKIDSINCEYNQAVSTLHTKIKVDEYSFHDIEKELLNKNNVLIYGERGIGKTTILKRIFYSLVSSLKDDLENGCESFFVPLFIDLESLWSWKSVVYNNALFELCKKLNIPYCINQSVKYIVILDGEMKTSKGALPPAVDSLINPNSGTFSTLISQTKQPFLDGFICFEVNRLSFPDVIQYINQCLGSRTADFLDNLFRRTFAGSAVDYSTENGFFQVVREIFRDFRGEAEKHTSLTSKSVIDRLASDSFYSTNLANSTQTGRLPKSLTNENEIEIWRKLIRENEVFCAIRNPYYLNWLISLYKDDRDYIFPYRLNTINVQICLALLEQLDNRENSLKLVVDTFLVPLAKLIDSQNGKNSPIQISYFVQQLNNTDFNRIKDSLMNSQLINVANNEIVFKRDNYFEYFLKYAASNSMEDELRICSYSELTNCFISYIENDDPFEIFEKDSIEIAVDIINEERDSISFTESEKNRFFEIASKKLDSTKDFKKKASILNGVAKLFDDLSLSSGYDYLDIKESNYWLNINGKTWISRFPITFYHFDLFSKKDYSNPIFWVSGLDTIILNNGKYRKKPLEVDDTGYPLFHISNHPVVGITWYEANAFCKWLEKKLNSKYNVRLPAIDEIKPFLDIDKYNSFNSPSGVMFQSTTPITTFDTNENDLVDIIGNVWEWSSDISEFYGDTLATCYGGCWYSKVERDHLLTTYPAKLSSNNVGFRVVLEKSSQND